VISSLQEQFIYSSRDEALVLNWWLEEFGVEAVLFFGSALTGALLGAVLCWSMVNQLYRWRQRSSPAAGTAVDDLGERTRW